MDEFIATKNRVCSEKNGSGKANRVCGGEDFAKTAGFKPGVTRSSAIAE